MDFRFWIAGEDGLSCFDPQKNHLKTYTEENGLVGNIALGVLCDQAGDIWIGTSKGISHYEQDKDTFRNYDFYDGLFNSTFNVDACLRGDDGRLYFGGKTGLNVFDPRMVGCQTIPPPVAITSWHRNNIELPLAPMNNQVITVSHTDRLLTFEFATLSYARPEKNQYAYMLVGFDNNWIYAGTRRSAGFSDLQPGSYSLRVRGASACGQWNESGATLMIEVPPPYWQTGWFRLIMIVLLSSMTLAGYRWRIRSLVHRQRELEELVAIRTREIADTQEIYRSLIETSPDAIMMTDLEGTIIMANQQAAVIYGVADALDVVGMNTFAFYDDNPVQLEEMTRQLKDKGGVRNIQFIIKKSSGQTVTAEMNATLLNGEESNPFNLIAVIRDITEQKSMEEQLRRLATTDSLTGINNLHRFLQRAGDEIKRAIRYQNPLAFLLIDLDHFNQVNDTFGHPMGDKVLQTMTAEGMTLLRETDVFGRLGGEEFGVLLIETAAEQALEIAERLRSYFEELSIPSEQGPIHFTVSIGLSSLKSPDRITWDALLLDADKALYQAKGLGRNRVVQHD